MPVLDATIEDITFRNDENGWTVLRAKDGRERLTAVGVMPFVGAGERVRLTGEWTEHPSYGRQLKVSAIETLRPETKTGVEKYLASGLIKGVGPATAKLLVDHFGAKALRVLESEPDRLTEVDGIGPKRARMIAESFAEQMEMRQSMLFLQNYDIAPALAMRIYRHFGPATQEVVKNNPYRLADEVNGVGFKTADRIAYAAGFPKDSPHRLKSGIRYALEEAAGSAGHAYLPREALIYQAQRLLDVDEDRADLVLRDMALTGQLVISEVEEGAGVYLPSLYEAECDVARRMVRLMRSADAEEIDGVEGSIARYERDEGVELCGEQRDAIAAAVTSGVTIITGGPGTGKTTGIRAIIYLMSHRGEVLLAAPTGRAAKRMSEATGCPASTIHRLLEFAGEEGAFGRDEDNPLNAQMIIIDEMSMVDVFLMRNLLRAIRPGTRLVMVGDADQLPSVGAGNVLRDLIQSGAVPVVRLTEIFRQAGESMIVRNAHRINHGEPPVVNGRGSDFFMERCQTIGEVVEKLIDLVVRRLPERMGLSALRDIQVLSPMKKGDAGVWQLNRLLQDRLNPRRDGVAERVRGEALFRLGDKVMQVRNNYQMEWSRQGEEGSGVFNGDMGFVVAIDNEDQTLTVRFDDDREAIYDDAALEELELSYCVSVHKSQGSEFPAVVMPVVQGPPMLMARNLLYTAVTRARKLVVLVGSEQCAMQMVRNNRTLRRYSALARRMRDAGREMP